MSLARNMVALSKVLSSAQQPNVVRNVATKAKARTTEERKSRQASKIDKTAAHEKFPFLPIKASRHIYILDTALAGEIARAVTQNQEDVSVPVLEANPGTGVLTEALLKAGVNRIVLAESLKEFIPYLEDLKTFSQKIMRVYNWDYLSVWRRLAEVECPYKHHEDQMAALLPHKTWAESPPLSVVGVLADKKDNVFLHHLLYSCAREYGLFLLGRPEWFIVISPATYKHLVTVKEDKNRTSRSFSRLAIMLHLVFEIRLCAELPAWKFTPSFPEKRQKLEDDTMSPSMRYLIRLRPHVEQQLPLSQIPVFLSFLSQVMSKKKQRFIPKMEQLIPGCGIHLIMSGFSMLAVIADVSPTQYVSIFKTMQTWPEYDGSPLKQHLAESAVSESVIDDDEDSHKQD
ncbi:dimethyladenosine transferase 2, mitochondrial-like isoform X2 [Littorina saxatilis]|uniref:dimethyladenosine transferase 2, mitochondrial-like isoform X2 n=1 Tax=Littorina saxatilis TaxID=31220 RepID=UPI0038B4A0A8